MSMIPSNPAASDYGYVVKGRPVAATRESLIEVVRYNPAVTYVWTPDTPEPVLPQTIPFLLEVFRTNLRKQARTAILIGIALVLLSIAAAIVFHEWSLLYRNLFFVIGALALTEGIWQYARLRHYTQEDAISDVSAARFTEWLKTKAVTGYTFTLAACIVVVGMAQLLSTDPIGPAGLVKPAVRDGQIWRLFTATLMHANFIHFWMNSLALIHLSKTVEQTVQRACVPLVFLFSGAVGSVLSVLLYPNTTSIGASGGLMGLLGFITIAARYDRTRYPLRYFRLMIEAIISVGLLGLIGFAFIDNAAHLGGLIGGLFLGWLCFRKNERWINENEKLVKGAGAAALFALIVIAAFAVYRLVR